jgi:16S rRNA U1498 N3-methylase RsmE
MQANVVECKRQKAKLEKVKRVSITANEQQETSKLPEVKTGKRQSLDLIKLGKTMTKVKVESGAGPSSVRVAVEKEQPLPLVECMIKRHEATKNLYHCLGEIRNKQHEDFRKLLSLS